MNKINIFNVKPSKVEELINKHIELIIESDNSIEIPYTIMSKSKTKESLYDITYSLNKVGVANKRYKLANDHLYFNVNRITKEINKYISILNRKKYLEVVTHMIVINAVNLLFNIKDNKDDIIDRYMEIMKSPRTRKYSKKETIGIFTNILSYKADDNMVKDLNKIFTNIALVDLKLVNELEL